MAEQEYCRRRMAASSIAMASASSSWSRLAINSGWPWGSGARLFFRDLKEVTNIRPGGDFHTLEFALPNTEGRRLISNTWLRTAHLQPRNCRGESRLVNDSTGSRSLHSGGVLRVRWVCSAITETRGLDHRLAVCGRFCPSKPYTAHGRTVGSDCRRRLCGNSVPRDGFNERTSRLDARFTTLVSILSRRRSSSACLPSSRNGGDT